MIEHSANIAIEGCSYRRVEIASVVFFNETRISILAVISVKALIRRFA
jgi:hypothetical protein